MRSQRVGYDWVTNTFTFLVSDHVTFSLSRLLDRQQCLRSHIYSHLGPLPLPHKRDDQVYCSLHDPLGRFSLSTVFQGYRFKYPQSRLTHSLTSLRQVFHLVMLAGVAFPGVECRSESKGAELEAVLPSFFGTGYKIQQFVYFIDFSLFFFCLFHKRKSPDQWVCYQWLVSFPRNSALVFTVAKLGSQQCQPWWEEVRNVEPRSSFCPCCRDYFGHKFIKHWSVWLRSKNGSVYHVTFW